VITRITKKHGRKRRYLVVGSLPPPLGGTTVSLAVLIKELTKRNDIDLKVLDTNISRHAGALRRIHATLKFCLKFICMSFLVDHVSFQISPTASKFCVPLLWIVKILRKKSSLRLFGGELPNSPSLRVLIKRADVVFLQTKNLVNRAQVDYGITAFWFPTHRPTTNIQVSKRAEILHRQDFRFIFLGHARREKGILDLFTAVENLKSTVPVTVDIVGKVWPEVRNAVCPKNARLMNEVEPDKIQDLLHEYDALVFPTWWEGEGYPGVIIEAMLAGLPIISTKWRDIPELVTPECGILVQPQAPHELATAMSMLINDRNLHKCLSNGAQLHGKQFLAEKWANNFVELTGAPHFS
jgi:glycosyltransferase involved in cell wall biosynthesis